MIIDTSALLAILRREPESARFAELLAAADSPRMSVASYLEASLWIDRNLDEVLRALLDDLIAEFSIELEPVTIAQIRLARQAFQLFGKGRHPAGLNFGDCFTYSLAKSTREPLLFKGNDFSQTDLRSALE